YGVNGGGGFVLLSGEIGAGKTTVCRCFLEQIPRRCNVAYIFNPKLTVRELLQSVCEEFGVPLPEGRDAATTIKDYLDPLNEFLLKTHAVGQNNVLIIDEAQMLSAEVLEQLRLLTNLETNERKLLQIVLIGQPELRGMLERPELEQLAQRVIARYHLGALTRAETEAYIRHRLAVAGMTTAMPFGAKALQRVHQLARGVPRRINLLCDRALLGAYALGKGEVDAAVVDQAAREVFGAERIGTRRRGRRAVWWGLGAAAATAGVAAVAALLVANGPPGGNGAAGKASAAANGASAVSASGGASAAAASTATTAAASAPIFLTVADLSARFTSPGRTENDAWRELAPAWKLAVADGDDPCTVAARSQLQCFRSANTSLALIRQLDRPGIVTLNDANEKPVHVLLTGLTGQTATLRAGAVSQTVSLVSLATLWRGDFATLWRVPPGFDGAVAAGGSGELGAWVTTQLNALQGGTLPEVGPASPGAWKARVTSFQLSQGLQTDGLAGPTTLMQLNRVIGIDEPHLRTDPPKP
ncbi:MAG: AAA family ATPase, partial [Burkholderiaceae bacterium]